MAYNAAALLIYRFADLLLVSEELPVIPLRSQALLLRLACGADFGCHRLHLQQLSGSSSRGSLMGHLGFHFRIAHLFPSGTEISQGLIFAPASPRTNKEFSSAPCRDPGGTQESEPRPGTSCGPRSSQNGVLREIANREAELLSSPLRIKAVLSSLPADVCVLGRFAVGSLLQPPRPDTCCSQELLLCSQSTCRRLKPSMPVTRSALPQQHGRRCDKGPCSTSESLLSPQR